MSDSPKFNSLFGLITNSNVKIKYDIQSNSVIEIEGFDGVAMDEIEISDRKGFNLPIYISILGIPYYPSKYEFLTGEVCYHSKTPPFFPIKINNVNSLLDYRAKEMKARITPDMLLQYDKSQKNRPRIPSQNSVMGQSAKKHVQKLVDSGILTVPNHVNVQWEWCHLVAFTMLPEHRAQTKRNLFAGTSACNAHMFNVEAAVKLFIQKVGRPVSLEVTATYLADTHLAQRIRYQVYEPKSETFFREYFDALTEVPPDIADAKKIYEKLLSS